MVTVAVARERVQYLNAQGKLITESLRDYTRINLTRATTRSTSSCRPGTTPTAKPRCMEELEGQGVLIDALADEVGTGLKDLDPFDLLLHVAYNMPPLTRRERARRVKKRNVFTQYGPVARKVHRRAARQIRRRRHCHHRSRQRAQRPALHRAGQPGGAHRSFGGRPQYLRALHTGARAVRRNPTAPPPEWGEKY
jgi:type I restriction enzyme R subunit